MTRYTHFRRIAAALLCSALGAGTAAADTLDVTIHRLWIHASDGAVRHRDLVKPAMDSLIAMGTEAIPGLLSYLRTEDARERHAITDIFKGIGTAAVPELVGVLGTGGRVHTVNTLTALGKIGDSAAIPAVVPFLTAPDFQVREKGAETLGLMRGERGLRPLSAALSDTIAGVRKAAVVALGRLGRPAAVDSLVAALDDPWFGVRYTAAAALVVLDSGATARDLTARLSGRPLALVLDALAAGRHALDAGRLWPLITDGELPVRRAAARLLGRCDLTPRDRSRIDERLTAEPDPLVRFHLQAAQAP